MKIKVTQLETLVAKALKNYGYNETEIPIISKILFFAQLLGNNQGVVKLIGKGIPRRNETGAPTIVKETPVSARFDGNKNHAIIVMNMTTETAIEKAKKNPIQKLLHGLSIHHLGKKASKLIAREVSHVLDLTSWDEEKFTNIKDIGPVVARNVMEYFKNPVNIEMLSKMETYGVNLTQTEEDKPIAVSEDAPLFGKTMLFTGTLTTMDRKIAQELAEKAGAKVLSGVSSQLNILVAGEKAGSKLKKAQELGTVEIWDEEKFAGKICLVAVGQVAAVREIHR